MNSDIPLVHVSSTLKSYKGCAKSAKICKNLVLTHLVDCECDVKEVAGGNYHHFGTCKHSKSQLAKNHNLIE